MEKDQKIEYTTSPPKEPNQKAKALSKRNETEFFLSPCRVQKFFTDTT